MARVTRIFFLIMFTAALSVNVTHALDTSPLNNSLQSLEIINITPTGEDVPLGNQITFQFNRPVVPVGRMDRDASEIPIVITPEVKGQWRWLNASTLALMLDGNSALKLATHYEITVNPGIRAEDGLILVGSLKHSFITKRPKVDNSRFITWEAPGIPVTRVAFNQHVSKESVEKHLFIKIQDKSASRIKITAQTDPEDNEFHFLSDGVEFNDVWLVSPEMELPPDTAIEYYIEPGLISEFGQEHGIENRNIMPYTLSTFPELSFIGIECTDNREEKVLIKPGKSHYYCNPHTFVSLVFSAPVHEKELMKNLEIDPPIFPVPFDYDALFSNSTSFYYDHQPGKKYSIALRYLKADSVYNIKSKPGTIFDVFGRILKTPIDIKFATSTGQLPSFFETIDTPVVLEKGVDTDMYLAAGNLDNLKFVYNRLTSKGEDKSLILEIPTPDTKESIVKIPAHIRETLKGASGIVQGEFVTSPAVVKENHNRWPSFIQVTPFHVHAKAGYFNTLVWVTDIVKGEPVSGARVKIFKNKHSDLMSIPENVYEGITDSEGTVYLPGTEKFYPGFNIKDLISNTHSVDDNDTEALFILVEKDEDISLLPFDLLRYGFRVPGGGYIGRYKNAWGVTAQGVYRPGDTVQYKIYLREWNMHTFTEAPKNGYDLEVTGAYGPGNTIFEAKDIELSEFGSIQGEFDLPDTITSGWYEFRLNKYTSPMKFLVADFTPSPFDVTIGLNSKNYLAGDKMEISTGARFFSGDPYNDASARVTVTLRKSVAYFFDDELAQKFNIHYPFMEKYSEQVLSQVNGLLDKNGDFETDLIIPENDVLIGELLIESAVRDDKGKYVTVRRKAKFASRDRFVGFERTPKFLYQNEINKPITNTILVMDSHGKPVAGVPVNIKIELCKSVPQKVKERGNNYKIQYKTETSIVEKQIIISQATPFDITFTPKEIGKYKISALVKDSKGREHSTFTYDGATYPGQVSRRGSEFYDFMLEVTPKKSAYKVGETARYVVKNPFLGSKALITIEQNGVLKHWVQTFDTDSPVVEFKIEEDFTPSFFISAVVMSPRSAPPPFDGQEDYGKPVFRVGYAKTIVENEYKKLGIEVKTFKETYKPGDRVRVEMHVSSKNDSRNEPFELAVVVLNEEVLSLIENGKDYFDLYKGFNRVDRVEMLNFNLLKYLLGQWKFESDRFHTIRGIVDNGAFPASSKYSNPLEKPIDLRSVLKFVSYWNPSIVADSEGKAQIEFEAPDNLTGWRIFTMAVTPTDQMGLGEGRFIVTRDTEIRPVMPNQVTEGDSFKAGFSIMNRIDKTRELTMTITAEGAIETDPGKTVKQITQTINVDPFKRTTVYLPIKTKGSGKILFSVKGGDAADRDGLVHELEVRKMTNLETAATYGTTVDGAVIEQLSFPDDIKTDIGEVKVSLSPSVIGNVEGAFRYVRDYPYRCWEPILTKGLMAAHYQNLKKNMPDEFTWEDSEKLTQSMLDKAASHQAPNGGIAYFNPQDEYADFYLSAYTAVAFTWLEERGYNIPEEVQSKLNGYLLDMFKNEEISDFYSSGMVYTVRAVALAALADQGKISIDDMKRYYPHVKDMDLFGKAHFLLAAVKINGTEDMQKEIFSMILSCADQTGGKFIFNETIDSGYSRILSSSIRTNAAVLSSLIAYGKTEEGKNLVGDIPFKLVRYITQTRKQSGRWENTQENIFCMNALVEYSKAYETDKPDMKIVTFMDDKIIGDAIFNGVQDDAVVHTKPIESKDPGRKSEVIIERKGKGRLYYSVGIDYSPLKPNTEPINAGIDIKREYSVERNGEWILLKSPVEIKRGELVRVDLFVSLPTARNFVVVDDPVPGGLEPINSDLATSSQVDADKGVYKPAGGSWWFHYGDWSYYGMSRWSFYHRELRHHAVRFYSEYLSVGNYHLSYTAQAIASGEFTVMPTHAEEMYDPDVFGKSSTAILDVKMED